MNKASTLPDHLSPAQRSAIMGLVERAEFLPISCLFYRADEHCVITPKRVIVDDFLYFPVSGTLNCNVGNRQRVIGPGEFMMVPAGVEHGVTMADGVKKYEVYALHMHLYDETRYRYFEKMDLSFGSFVDRNGWFSRLAACTCIMGHDPKAGGVYMKQLVIDLMVDQILRGHTLQELATKTDQRITLLLGNLRMYPAKVCTVTEMARHCNLSVSRFRELFAETTGTSPKKYLQNVRLSLARSLLMTNPLLTVEQVADQVGISDAHYFHSIYKEHFGETPKKCYPNR